MGDTSNKSDKTDTTVKILVVGNSGVGKTSLCNRYINDRFVRAYKPTVGGIFLYLCKLCRISDFNWLDSSGVLF